MIFKRFVTLDRFAMCTGTNLSNKQFPVILTLISTLHFLIHILSYICSNVSFTTTALYTTENCTSLNKSKVWRKNAFSDAVGYCLLLYTHCNAQYTFVSKRHLPCWLVFSTTAWHFDALYEWSTVLVRPG